MSGVDEGWDEKELFRRRNRKAKYYKIKGSDILRKKCSGVLIIIGIRI
jgi:hypothetical protein